MQTPQAATPFPSSLRPPFSPSPRTFSPTFPAYAPIFPSIFPRAFSPPRPSIPSGSEKSHVNSAILAQGCEVYYNSLKLSFRLSYRSLNSELYPSSLKTLFLIADDRKLFLSLIDGLIETYVIRPYATSC